MLRVPKALDSETKGGRNIEADVIERKKERKEVGEGRGEGKKGSSHSIRW